MATRVAINGFGRTGRCTFRAAHERDAGIEIVAINDVMDVVKDRAHPLKRNRPIASGRLPLRTAKTAAAVYFKMRLRSLNATAYALATEAWMVTLTADEYPLQGDFTYMDDHFLDLGPRIRPERTALDALNSLPVLLDSVRLLHRRGALTTIVLGSPWHPPWPSWQAQIQIGQAAALACC